MRIRDRRVGIGASEVPVIAGISPYSTPVALWLRKGGSEEQDDNGAMAVGRALEVPVLRLAAARGGFAFRHNTVTRTHASWPTIPLYATPDAFGPGGEYLGEVKVVGAWNSADWAAGAPDYIRLQVQAQMAVYPAARFTLVIALLNGTDLRIEQVDRDEAAIGELEARVADWWREHIEGGTPPPPVSEEDRWALLRSMVRTEGRQERPATPEEDGTAIAYADLDRRAKELRGSADIMRRLLAEAARDVDLRGQDWTGRWHDRQGTPVFTVRVSEKKELAL